MFDPAWMQSTAVEFIIAGMVGLLVGRTRERAGGHQRAGIRDFVLLALTGGIAAVAGEIWLTAALAVSVTAALLVLRAMAPERGGITTELAGVATFGLGYLSLTQHTALSAALGIVLAILLAQKEQLHRFTQTVITSEEFSDTLKFLALVFVILPLLPEGRYGPFGFFDPRNVWTFVILVSGVAYVGYFVDRFVAGTLGLLLSAVLGGIASSTAHMTLMARRVREQPDATPAFAMAVMVANAVMYARMLLIAAVMSPALALAVAVPLTAMALASAAVGMLLRIGGAAANEGPAGAIGNPFALLPGLKFGLAFIAVTFLAHAGDHFFGTDSRIVTAALGGLIDVNAAMVSFGQLVSPSEADGIAPAVVIATASNAVFRFAIALSARSTGFAVRVGAGYLLSTAAGFASLLLPGLDALVSS